MFPLTEVTGLYACHYEKHSKEKMAGLYPGDLVSGLPGCTDLDHDYPATVWQLSLFRRTTEFVSVLRISRYPSGKSLALLLSVPGKYCMVYSPWFLLHIFQKHPSP